MAILEWIEETWPQPPLLPADPFARARVRAAADLVACDIHPLNNLATLAYLKGPLGHSQAEADAWYRHWIVEGFRALEQMIEPGPFCFGAAPGLADICLVPQLFNARRFSVPLDAFPRLLAAEAAASALEAFAAAHPAAQPDAE
jgi:maleylacetoacetate isomerase